MLLCSRDSLVQRRSEGLWAHVREQDNVTNGRRIGQQHHQPINADALPCGGRKAMLKGPNIVGIVVGGFFVSRCFGLELLQKPLALIFGIVQL